MINFLIKEKVLLVLILLMGFAARLYKFNSPLLDWHSFRQADTAAVGRLYLENGINLFLPKYYDISMVQSGLFNPMGYRFVEFPLYSLFHVYFARIFPWITFEEAGRLLSISCTLISAFFLYKIAKIFFSKYVALFSVFLYLFLPFNIYFTRVILPEPLAVMLGVTGLWFFLKYEKNHNLKNLIIYSTLMSLAILVKPYMVFYNFYPIYFFWKKYGLKKFINKNTVIVFLITFTPFILWRFWISKHPEGIPFWKWTLNGDGVRFKPAFWYWIFGERIGKLILGVWGVIPFSIGIILNRKNKFLISFLLGSLAYLFVFATANVRHDYYQTLIIPSIVLVLASGFFKILDDYKKEKYGFFFPVIILFLTILISAFQVKEYYKINHPEIVAAGSAVDKLTPKDALVIASYNGDTAFLYQTKRKGWPVVELPINELVQRGASFFVSIDLNDPQTKEFMKEFKIVEKTDKFVILDLKQKQI